MQTKPTPAQLDAIVTQVRALIPPHWQAARTMMMSLETFKSSPEFICIRRPMSRTDEADRRAAVDKKQWRADWIRQTSREARAIQATLAAAGITARLRGDLQELAIMP